MYTPEFPGLRHPPRLRNAMKGPEKRDREESGRTCCLRAHAPISIRARVYYTEEKGLAVLARVYEEKEGRLIDAEGE